MWCTSRASPASTTSPTRVRVLHRTRCSCTAAVSSNEGMGAIVAFELRSERMMMFEPSEMAMLTRRRTSSMASRNDAPPPDGEKRPSMAKALKPGVSPCSFT